MILSANMILVHPKYEIIFIALKLLSIVPCKGITLNLLCFIFCFRLLLFSLMVFVSFLVIYMGAIEKRIDESIHKNDAMKLRATTFGIAKFEER